MKLLGYGLLLLLARVAFWMYGWTMKDKAKRAERKARIDKAVATWKAQYQAATHVEE